jgi:hypothetical protein
MAAERNLCQLSILDCQLTESFTVNMNRNADHSTEEFVVDTVNWKHGFPCRREVMTEIANPEIRICNLLKNGSKFEVY